MIFFHTHSSGFVEELPLLVLRHRSTSRKDVVTSNHFDLENSEQTLVLMLHDVHIGKRIHGNVIISLLIVFLCINWHPSYDPIISESRFFDVMEGTYGKDRVVIKQIKDNISSRDILTLVTEYQQSSSLWWYPSGT